MSYLLKDCCRFLSFFNDRTSSNYHNFELPQSIISFPQAENSISQLNNDPNYYNVKILSSINECQDEKTNFIGSINESISTKDSIQESNELTTIELNNKYYDLNKQLKLEFLKHIDEGYDKYEKIYEDNKNETKLKIYLNSYLKEKFRVNRMKSEFIVKCSPKNYINVMNNIRIQKEISEKVMDEYKIIENISSDENMKILYSKYKKILTASSRDFLYYKHYECIDIINDIWIDFSQSIQEENIPCIDGVVRGDILLSGNYVEKINEFECKVIIFSEIDFKWTIPLIIAKPAMIMEMKKFVEKIQTYLQDNSF